MNRSLLTMLVAFAACSVAATNAEGKKLDDALMRLSDDTKSIADMSLALSTSDPDQDLAWRVYTEGVEMRTDVESYTDIYYLRDSMRDRADRVLAQHVLEVYRKKIFIGCVHYPSAINKTLFWIKNSAIISATQTLLNDINETCSLVQDER